MRYTLLVLLFALTDAAWGVACSGPAGPSHVECTLSSVGGTTTYMAKATGTALANDAASSLSLMMTADGVPCNDNYGSDVVAGLAATTIKVEGICVVDVPSDRTVQIVATTVAYLSDSTSLGVEITLLNYVPDSPLQVARVGSGTVSSLDGRIACGLDCTELYPAASTVTLAANPAFGWVFTGWSGACSGSARQCTLTMSQARNVTATFAFANTPPVVEFYNATLDHYFITAEPLEATAVDNGSAGPGWARTGLTFKPGGDTPVCRFYGSITPGPNSHFYTAFPVECTQLQQLALVTPASLPRWNFESIAFSTGIPFPGGACAPGTIPVYRAYNDGPAHGKESNHRFSTSSAAIDDVVARGWKSEGVVMCAPL
jgi:hypothetical protein